MRRQTVYDAVRMALGLLLLTAAALKGRQLATEAIADVSLLAARWFLIAAVEFELFFGLWLLAGIYPSWTRWAAMGCFGLFACVALTEAISGVASCGCFGKAPVNPWYTFFFDTFAVLTLVYRRPKGHELLSPPNLKGCPGGRWAYWRLGLWSLFPP